MEKEFNLSKKICDECFGRGHEYLEIEDVKEFIKRLKEEIIDSKQSLTTGEALDINEEIDKLAGEELK